MDKKKSIIILSIIFLVLLAGIFVLNIIDTDNSDTSSLDQPVVKIVDIAKEDVSSISVIDKQQKDSSSFIIEKDDMGNFEIDKISSFDKNQDRYTNFIESLLSLSSYKEVSKSSISDIKDFGLSPSKYDISISYKDGKKLDINIGNMAVDNSGYYLQTSDSEDIKLVKVKDIEKIMVGEKDFISDIFLKYPSKDGDIDPSIFTKISIKNKDQKDIINIETNKQSLEDKSDEKINYILTAPYSSFLENTAVQFILPNGDLKSDYIADYGKQSLDKKEYGFKSPTAEVVFTVEGKQHKIVIGSRLESKQGVDNHGHSHLEDQFYYVMVVGTDIVYEVVSSRLPWINLSVKELIKKNIFIPSLDKISTINFGLDGKDYQFKIEGEEENISAYIGDKKFDLNQFDEFFKEIAFIPIISGVEQNPVGKLLASIKYSYRKEDLPSDTIKLYKVNDREVSLILNDKMFFMVDRDYVEKVIASLKTFIK